MFLCRQHLSQSMEARRQWKEVFVTVPEYKDVYMVIFNPNNPYISGQSGSRYLVCIFGPGWSLVIYCLVFGGAARATQREEVGEKLRCRPSRIGGKPEHARASAQQKRGVHSWYTKHDKQNSTYNTYIYSWVNCSYHVLTCLLPLFLLRGRLTSHTSQSTNIHRLTHR